jgi:hypothetical protein
VASPWLLASLRKCLPGVLADGGGDVAVVEVFEAGGEPFVLAVSNQAPVITSQDAGTP